MRRYRRHRPGGLRGASRGHALQHRLAARSRFSRFGAMEQYRCRFPHFGRPGLGVGPGERAAGRACAAPCRTKAGADGCVAATRDIFIRDTSIGDAAIFGDAAGEQAAPAPRLGSGCPERRCTEHRSAERRRTECKRVEFAGRGIAAQHARRRAQRAGVGLANRSGRRTSRRAGRRDSFIGEIGSGRACRECRPRGVHRQRSARLRQSSHHQTRRQFVVRVRS